MFKIDNNFRSTDKKTAFGSQISTYPAPKTWIIQELTSLVE